MDWSALVGLPWRDRGRGSDGYDCWGLIVAAFAAGPGIALPSHDGQYRTASDREDVRKVFAGEVGDWLAIEEAEARPFDVAVMTIAGRMHAGVIVRPGMMLHMPANKTSVIERLDRFRPVLTGLYRHLGMM
jgi:murein DD-endopeptidase